MRPTSSAMAACALLTLIAFGLCAGPGSARAEGSKGIATTADEADVQFRLGNMAYSKRDYRTALSHYFTSNRLAPNRNVLFNIARCYEQLKQYVEACRYYLAFEAAFEAAGDLKPAQRKALNKAMARVRPFVSLLRIASQPAGATIYLNRKELGSYGATPTVLAVAPGTYRVLLELPGYQAYGKQSLELHLGKSLNLEARMDRVVGRVELRGSPSGAQTQIDLPEGPLRGNLPGDWVVPPGQYSVRVSREGYVAQEQRILVKAGETSELQIDLVRRTGSLLVQSDEKDALIRIDGQAVGFTPAVIDKLPIGSHRVTVQQAGFHLFDRQVEVVADKQAVLDVQLDVAEDVAAASRLVESARDAPASVSLIGRREISAMGYMDLYDAVQGTRGVFASNDLTYKNVGLRGFSPFGQYGNRLLVLMDGHSLNDDWIGSSYVGFDLMTDLGAIDQIELIRGPGSALYGTGAFFGVLNLVSPARMDGTRLRASLGTVGPGMVRSSAFGGGRFGDSGEAAEAGFWITAGGLFEQAGDYYSPARVGDPAEPFDTATGVGASRAATGMGKLYWRDLTLQFYYHMREKQISTGSFETIFGDTRTRSDDNRSFVELRYEPKLSEWFQLLSRLYYDHYGYDGVFPYDDDEVGVAREYYLGDWVGAELRGLFQFDFGLRLTVGGSYEMHFANPGSGTDAGGTYFRELHPYQVFSGYLVADYLPVRWLGLSAGCRFDGWLTEDLPQSEGGVESKFLYSVNPRLGIILRPSGNDTIKLLGGTAFRAPSIYELTYWDGGITQVPSPDITPETIYTGELEYTRRLPAGFWLVASVFLNRISDLLEQEGEGDEVDPLHYVNLDEAVWILGGELELRKEFRRGWMLALQYSFQRTRLGDAFDGEEPANAPAHMAGGKLILPLAGKALRLSTRVMVESGRLDRDGERTDPAVIWDLILSGEVEPIHMRYSAGVRNLLDWRVEHPVGEDLLDTRVLPAGLRLVIDLSFAY